MSLELSNYDLFLFDCDGLLVDSERMHYDSFMEAFSFFNIPVSLDYVSYCQLVGHNLDSLKQFALGGDPFGVWGELYAYKNQRYIGRLRENRIELMPGVREVLVALAKLNKKSVVVTNGTRAMIPGIIQRHDCLRMIEDWVTRECYENPKPAPDAYVYAYNKFFYPGIRVIGFEDSEKGLRSLTGIPAQAVLVNPTEPSLKLPENVVYLHSLEELLRNSP